MKFNNFPPTQYRDAEFTDAERMILERLDEPTRSTCILSYAVTAASTITELNSGSANLDTEEIIAGLHESLILRGTERKQFATEFSLAFAAASIEKRLKRGVAV